MSELPPPPSEDPVAQLRSEYLQSQLNNARERPESPIATATGDEEVTEQTKEKLRTLAELTNFKTARREKVARPTGSTSTSSRLSDLETSTSTSSLLSPPELSSPTQLLPPAPTTSSSTKRRTGKNANADRRNTDIEFATEIGHHLLIEVRKLQTLLQEKDEIIKQLEITKAEYERTMEVLQKQLRQTQESEDRYKNEVWQLELTRQELESKIAELETNLQKTTSEANRLAKQLNSAGEQIETLKATEETLTQNVESAKVKYETDMGVLRRNFAGAQRDKSELQKKIDELQGELETANKRIRVTRVHNVIEGGAAAELAENELGPDGQPTGPNDGTESPTATPPASPTRSPKRQVLEAETLKASLGHAHTMIDKLRTSLHREQTEKEQLKKLLDERQEEIENMRDEGLFDGKASTMSMSKKKSRGFRETSESKALKTSGGKKKSRARRPKGMASPDGADSDDAFGGAGDPIDEEMRRNDIPFGAFGGVEEDDDDDGEYYGSDGEALGISSPFGNFAKGHHLTDGLEQPRPLFSEIGDGAFGNSKELVDVGVNTDPWDGKNPGTAVATDPMSPRPVDDKITRAEAEMMRDEAVKAAVAEALAKERETTTQPRAQRLAELQSQDTRRHTFGGDFSDLELEDAILGGPASATESNRGSLEAVALGGVAAVAAATTPTIMADTKARKSHEGSNGLAPPPRPPTSPPQNLTSRINTTQRNYMPTKLSPTNGQPEGSSTLRVEGRLARSGSVASASTVSTDASTDRRPSFHDMQTSNGRSELGVSSGANSDIIAAITQTMIGRNLYKYTRRTVGGGLSERRHKRFFWIHPYTKTLYWSTQEPGTQGATEKAKSAYIMAVEVVPDYSNSPPDLPKVSLLIKTPNRDIKLTAPTKQEHDMWFQSLSYLLSRSSDNHPAPNGNHTDHSYDQSNVTDEPFGRSLRKKSSYNKISSLFNPPRGRDIASSSRERAISPRPEGPVDMAPGMFDDEIRSDDERPENVFQCCDGKHDVSTLERDHHHHHHQHSHHFHAGKRFERLPSRS